jgi:hypothetical protein
VPEFYAWYKPEEWLWWGRALGAFIHHRHMKLQDRIDDLELFLQDLATEFPGQEMSRRILAFLAEGNDHAD